MKSDGHKFTLRDDKDSFDTGPMLHEAGATLYLASNAVLIVLGIILVPFFGPVLKVPKAWLLPLVLLLSAMGTYALQNSVFDLWVMLVFGVVGYVLRKAHSPLAPIIIGMILGPVLENNLRRALLLSRDGPMIFIERPISATILSITAMLLIYVVIATMRPKRSG